MLDALPADQQVKVQALAAQARQFLDQPPIGAQLIGRQGSLVRGVEPTIPAGLCGRIDLNSLGLEGDRNRRRHADIDDAREACPQVGSELVRRAAFALLGGLTAAVARRAEPDLPFHRLG
ncbi:MAG: hypothetical protein ABI702_21600 [Burkholderiales bacterium]